MVQRSTCVPQLRPRPLPPVRITRTCWSGVNMGEPLWPCVESQLWRTTLYGDAAVRCVPAGALALSKKADAAIYLGSHTQVYAFILESLG